MVVHTGRALLRAVWWSKYWVWLRLYVVPDGFGGDRELASILTLYRDASRAVNKEVGHPVLIPTGVLKIYEA